MPAVVQTASNSGSGASVTVTLGSATTAGNCLVVYVTGVGSSAPSVSGITIGGSASNFAALKSASATNSITNFVLAAAWACPACPGGQTSVVVSGANLSSVVVDEVSGLAPTIGTLLDKFSTGASNANGTAWSSGTTGTTTAGAEYIGGVAVDSGAMTGPASPWSNTSPVAGSIAGRQVASATGTFTYSGTAGTSSQWAAVAVTLFPVVTPAPFASPRRAPRGAAGAGAGRSAASGGAPYSWTLFSGQGGSTLTADPNPYTLGTQFGITGLYFVMAGVRFFSAPGASVLPQVIALFNADTATLVHSEPASWSGPAGGGYLRAVFSSPPPLTAGTNYVAAVLQNTSANWYSTFAHYWDTGPGANGIVDGPLRAPGNATALRGQCVFNVGSTLTFPTSTFNASNYWVDPEIQVIGPPPTPSPFAPPGVAPRGTPAARRGRAASSAGAPQATTPARFALPARPVRGTPRARRGQARTGLSSAGAPVTPPPAPKTLLISLASAAGTDDYGTPYPQGILATAGVIEGPQFVGTDFVINTSGYFSYSGTPAANNLISSIAPVAGTDDFGNHYVAGTASYASSLATALTAGAITTYTGSLFFGWTAKAVIQTNTFGDLILEASSGRQVVTLNNILDDGTGGASFQSTVTVGAANLNVGTGASANINLSPQMAVPPNYPLSGSSTTAQIAAFCNAIKDSLHNRGMMA